MTEMLQFSIMPSVKSPQGHFGPYVTVSDLRMLV